jgi:hypothetical protein
MPSCRGIVDNDMEVDEGSKASGSYNPKCECLISDAGPFEYRIGTENLLRVNYRGPEREILFIQW